MAVAQGSCPNCGAPIEFGLGASLAKICEYCRATVVRSDRGLENLGIVADLADTPSLIAVGDEGALSGRPFRVFGRVQLDHGQGPWDEYYVAFDHGRSWGWLAFAEGRWHVTEHVAGPTAPPYASLRLEQDIPLGPHGVFRVTEIKTGRVTSAEGELPGATRPGTERYYADLFGRDNAFGTLDFGDGRSPVEVFLGFVFEETRMQVSALGPRSARKVQTSVIACPNCGGELPRLSGERAERLGCPYCGAVSDIATQRIVSQQEAARAGTDIPMGGKAELGGASYVCIAYVRRRSDFEGERYRWEEYLVWAASVGFRWLVKDPETGWSWVTPVNPAEIDLRGMPDHVRWHNRSFLLRNRNVAEVEYVLGEVYWKCEVGERTRVSDLIEGGEVLSREESPGEVRWSHSAKVPWSVLAQAFGLDPDGPGKPVTPSGSAGGAGCGSSLFYLLVLGLILVFVMMNSYSAFPLGVIVGGASRGGGVYFGGK
ncbi:MAG TPA: DUF4178 domain-containing protein [Polyangiaceae bacterium]